MPTAKPNDDPKIEMVKVFNKTFGVPTSKNPTLLSEDDYSLKYDLMKEELREYLNACRSNDLVEVCDAVVDMMYILNGIVVSHGLHDIFTDLFSEVHNSNMSKLENGKVLRRHDGKVMKGSEYFKPNLKQYL